MPLEEKNHSLIKEIVSDLNLSNKVDPSNPREYIFRDPKMVLAELVVKYKKGKLKKENFASFLQERLKIEEGRAEKIISVMNKKIISEMDKRPPAKNRGENSQKKKSAEDKYREPIE